MFSLPHGSLFRADNAFKIDFLEFSIRDLDMPKGSSEIFAVRQSEPLPACVSIPDDIEVCPFSPTRHAWRRLCKKNLYAGS